MSLPKLPLKMRLLKPVQLATTHIHHMVQLYEYSFYPLLVFVQCV